MKKRNIAGGIALILLAAYVIVSRMNLLPFDISWFKLVITVFMGYIVVKSIPKKNFFGMIMPLCIIGCLFDTELGIEAITPWTLLFAGALIGGGLSMIFRKKPNSHIRFSGPTNSHTENYQDGSHVYLENSFNSVIKYVNSEDFTAGTFRNSFGSANIYFGNAIMAHGQATVDVENSFGEMNIYFPKTWGLQASQESSFGNVAIYGSPNTSADAPLIHLKAESSFGNINIYFD